MLTPSEAEYMLNVIIERYQRTMQLLMQPLIAERMRVHDYLPTGPGAPRYEQRYQAPRWLEDSCRGDPKLRAVLASFRK